MQEREIYGFAERSVLCVKAVRPTRQPSTYLTEEPGERSAIFCTRVSALPWGLSLCHPPALYSVRSRPGNNLSCLHRVYCGNNSSSSVLSSVQQPGRFLRYYRHHSECGHRGSSLQTNQPSLYRHLPGHGISSVTSQLYLQTLPWLRVRYRYRMCFFCTATAGFLYRFFLPNLIHKKPPRIMITTAAARATVFSMLFADSSTSLSSALSIAV